MYMYIGSRTKSCENRSKCWLNVSTPLTCTYIHTTTCTTCSSNYLRAKCFVIFIYFFLFRETMLVKVVVYTSQSVKMDNLSFETCSYTCTL